MLKRELVLNSKGTNISPSVLELFNSQISQISKSFEEAIQSTQKKWIRPKDSERWESGAYLELSKEEEEKAFHIFEKNLFMTGQIIPSKKEYDVAIILGALAQTMRYRFSYLVELLEKKEVRVKNIVFLVGARPIFPDKETPEKLLGNYNHTLPIRKDWKHEGSLPKTEVEAARLIADQVSLSDEDLRKRIFFVNTPMQKTKEGKLRRPSTIDTVATWLKTKPEVKTVLSFSSNPYCGYQHAVMTRLLPKKWEIETIGKKPGRGEIVEIYFDTVARWLYQYR